MRWFAWLVALCLLAAGSARPDAPRLLDHHEATVEDASDLATLLPRRPSTLSPDKRSDRRLDIAGPSPRPPVLPIARGSLAARAEPRPSVSATHVFAHSSRGPPVYRAASSQFAFS